MRVSKEWPRYLRTLMKLFDVDQQGLAEKIGCSASTLSGWLGGGGGPDVVNMRRVADLAGVSVHEVLSVAYGEPIPDMQGLTTLDLQVLSIFRQLPEREQDAELASWIARSTAQEPEKEGEKV